MVILLDNWQMRNKRKSPPQEQRQNHRINKRSLPNEDTSSRRKPKNIVKELNTSGVSDSSNDDEGINPISRLLRMQQAAKKAEPVYVVIDERGHRKGKEFVMEVECNGQKAQGSGPSKKLAKRMAAKNYLILAGIDKDDGTTTQTNKSPTKSRKISFKAGQTEDASDGNVSPGRDLSQMMSQMSKSILL